MAIVLIEGFEGGLVATADIPNVGTINTTTPRPRAGGPAGAYSATRFAAANDATMSRLMFPYNADRGRALRLREVAMGYGFLAPAGTLPATPQLQTYGFGANIERQIGALPLLAGARLYRGNTLVSTGDPALSIGAWTAYWFDVFIAGGTAGRARLRNGGLTQTFFDVTGSNTQNILSTDYVNMLMWGSLENLARVDDIVVLAPSLRLTNAVGNAPTGTVLTGGTSGAVVTVSDDEPSKGRWWVHSWNGTPFIDGEVITGAGFTALLVAPNPTFIGGFEPRSFPYAGVPFVLALRPTANGAPIELTPVGSPTNVNNINPIPETTAAYNEATSGLPLQDRYTTLTALPSWVQNVQAVQADPVVSMDGSYIDVTAALTDPSGTQSFTSDGTAAINTRARSPFPFRSNGTAWGLADVAALQVAYTLAP
jgi:hypothetical protein